MYDLRQFKPALYALVILGVTGFAIAAESGAVWVLGVGSILANYWGMRSGGFKPLPRLLANSVTVLSVMILLWMLHEGAAAPILLIGHFLVLLQVVKLYEQRANRDYAQLLALGPLLMVAGAISTYSLIFGLLFIGYLILWLYCCLLFHLKVETDLAMQTMGFPIPASGATVIQHQGLIGRSMRWFTTLIAVFAVSSAVLTFLFFPRISNSSMFSPFEWKPSQALTGFSDSVNFQNVAMIAQNSQPVAWVTVTRKNGQSYANPLVLRGTTLDRYSSRGDESGGSAYQWTRSSHDKFSDDLVAGRTRRYDQAPLDGSELRQEIKLDPTGTNVLFAMGGIVSFTPKQANKYLFWRHDQVLQAADSIIEPIEYVVISRDRLSSAIWPLPEERPQSEQAYLRNIDPKIEAFARRIEVSGSDAQGALETRRPSGMLLSPLDLQIAQNMETYLRTNFTYTLDLTDARRIAGQDPLVAFLYDLKRGHCEYFAGAMTLMCQSLGMQARMVVGFRCDEYNAIGNYYTVRQSHAHAWVEVLGDDGVWHTFDPTSSREDTLARNDSAWQRIQAFFSYMEYTWANTVVAYDPASRDNLIDGVSQHFAHTTDTGSRAVSQTAQWLSQHQSLLPGGWTGWLVGTIAAMLVATIIWWIARQWHLRRRAKRIGLEFLPQSQRVKLARQLGFYDDLMQLLDRHRIQRPAHLTPLEFSRSLDFLPAEAFNSIRGITEAFYRVRYGHVELSVTEYRGLFNAIAQVENLLADLS